MQQAPPDRDGKRCGKSQSEADDEWSRNAGEDHEDQSQQRDLQQYPRNRRAPRWVWTKPHLEETGKTEEAGDIPDRASDRSGSYRKRVIHLRVSRLRRALAE